MLQKESPCHTSLVGRVSLSDALPLHVVGFWSVARQVGTARPCTVFLQRKGKEGRGAATVFSVGIFVLTGIKKEGKSAPLLPGPPNHQNWILQHVSVS